MERLQTKVPERMKEAYDKACMAYINAFAKKQDIEFEDWIDEPGCTCLFADFYLNFHDVKRDIDMDAPKGLFIDWYYDVLEYREKNGYDSGCGINYANYIKCVRFDNLTK